MKVIKNDKTIFVDVDNTLIEWEPSSESDKAVVVAHNGESKKFYALQKTVEAVKTYSMQGFFVVVHSGAGYSWGEAVVKALNLEEYVDMVMTKARYYQDDEPADSWMLRLPPRK